MYLKYGKFPNLSLRLFLVRERMLLSAVTHVGLNFKGSPGLYSVNLWEQSFATLIVIYLI